MKIGIIGAGHIGQTLGTLLAGSGQEVMLSGRDTRRITNKMTPGLRQGTFHEAATFGELIVLAIPWQSAVLEKALPDPVLFAGKIVIDTMNPDSIGAAGLHKLQDRSSSNQVASLLPGARVVKAFNTMFWEDLRDLSAPGAAMERRNVIFVSGDDEDAKHRVCHLIADIGFAPADIGTLEGSRSQEPGSTIYNYPMLLSEAMQALAKLGIASSSCVLQ